MKKLRRWKCFSPLERKRLSQAFSELRNIAAARRRERECQKPDRQGGQATHPRRVKGRLPLLTRGLLTRWRKKQARPSVQLKAEPFALRSLPARYPDESDSANYAVNEEPQPQLPVEFGFLNVKPEPITFVT